MKLYRSCRPFLVLFLLCAAACNDEPRGAVVTERVRRALLEASPSRPVLTAVSLRTHAGGRDDLVDDVNGIRRITTDIRFRLDGSGARVSETFGAIPGIRVELSGLEDLELLAGHPNVAQVDLDTGGEGSLDASREHTRTDQAFRTGLVGTLPGSTRVKVAILDTGINTHHLSFLDDHGNSRVVDRACFCATDLEDDICCPDDENPLDGDPGLSVEDDVGHGSHVAGIVGSNGAGSPRGMAPGVDLVVVRVMNNNTFHSTGDIIRALNWVADAHPDVAAVNVSLGTWSRHAGYCDLEDPTPTNLDLRDAVQRIRNNGGVVVAATGNDGDPEVQAPACLSNTIAVGHADARASMDVPVPAERSNRGLALDLFAPGTSIHSASRGILNERGRIVPEESTHTSAYMTGTSMATPHVTGAVALMRQAYPLAEVEVVESCLRNTENVPLTLEQDGFDAPMLDIPSLMDCMAKLTTEDSCPDTAKRRPGQCGCGTPDVDADGDGTADCIDRCPSDPRKIAPGRCGCHIADTECSWQTPTLTASEEKTAHFTAARAHDGLTHTSWRSPTASAWLQQDFDPGQGRVINRYSLTTGRNRPDMDPKEWTLLGRVEGGDWKKLDSRKRGTCERRECTHTYSFKNSKVYESYLLRIASNRSGNDGRGVQLAEFKLHGAGSEPVVRAAGGKRPSLRNSAKAVDGNTDTAWVIAGDSAYLEYVRRDGEPMLVNAYRLTAANNRPARDPRDFRVLGSRNGAEWDVLDERFDQRFSERHASLTYLIDNTEGYQVYRLEILSRRRPQKGNAIQLAEFELLHLPESHTVSPGTSNAEPPTRPLRRVPR